MKLFRNLMRGRENGSSLIRNLVTGKNLSGRETASLKLEIIWKSGQEFHTPLTLEGTRASIETTKRAIWKINLQKPTVIRNQISQWNWNRFVNITTLNWWTILSDHNFLIYVCGLKIIRVFWRTSWEFSVLLEENLNFDR